MSAPVNVTRRQLLISSMTLALGLTVAPSVLWAGALNEQNANPALPLLERLCELVIPKTETAGARELGVAQFVVYATKHAIRNSSENKLALFEKALDKYVQSSFRALSLPKQFEHLTVLDNKVFSRTNTDIPDALLSWREIKQLIVIGYYTSEVGSTQELRYQLVPGKYQPNVPLSKDSRAWSSDWTGVKFG